MIPPFYYVAEPPTLSRRPATFPTTLQEKNNKQWRRISTANWPCFPLPLFFSTIDQQCSSHSPLLALCSLSTWELCRLGKPDRDLVSVNLANALDQDFWLEKQQQQSVQCPGVKSSHTLPPQTEPAACNHRLQVKASKSTTSAQRLWHLYDGKGWEALGKLWARLQINALNWRQLLLLGAILGLQQSRLSEHPPHHAPALLFTAVCSSEKHLHLSHLLRV